MRQIKLSGREMAVLRGIDYANGSTGAEIFERTQIAEPDLVDILNSLAEIGYVEAYRVGSDTPFSDAVPPAEFCATRFEVNPSYALQLREAMKR